MAFYMSIGKKPILLNKELPGHVANRLQIALYAEVMYLIQQGVLSVADADDAVSYGPGLRWGVMGPSLQWHLGGGAGGIKHFMDHFMDPMAGLIKTLGTPDVTPELKKTIAEGVLQEAGDHSVDQLAQNENELLVGLLRLRSRQAPRRAVERPSLNDKQPVVERRSLRSALGASVETTESMPILHSRVSAEISHNIAQERQADSRRGR